MPVDVTINLTEREKHEVDQWFSLTPAADASQVVLFECSSKSGQSFMTTHTAQQIAQLIVEARTGAVVIISTHEKLAIEHPRVIHGGTS